MSVNRRTALAMATTLPALAVPAAVAGAMPDASERKLLALEADIYRAWDGLSSACEIMAPVERALGHWREQNPKPEIRRQTQEEIQSLYRHLMRGEHQEASAEYDQASASHKRALAEWGSRYEAAKEATGYNRASELQSQANDRLDDAIMDMCHTPAMTIEGFRCKARTALKVERANAEPDLAWSIVDDLAGETS